VFDLCPAHLLGVGVAVLGCSLFSALLVADEEKLRIRGELPNCKPEL
jgi:hypothetical protein